MKKFILFIFALSALSVHGQTLTTAKAKWEVIKNETTKGANTATRIGLAGEDIVAGVRDTLKKFISDVGSDTIRETKYVKQPFDFRAPQYLNATSYSNPALYGFSINNRSTSFATLELLNTAPDYAGFSINALGSVKIDGQYLIKNHSNVVIDTAATKAYARSLVTDFYTKAQNTTLVHDTASVLRSNISDSLSAVKYSIKVKRTEEPSGQYSKPYTVLYLPRGISSHQSVSSPPCLTTLTTIVSLA